MSVDIPWSQRSSSECAQEIARLNDALASVEAGAKRQYDLLDAMFVRGSVAMSLSRVDVSEFVDVNAQWQELTGISWEQAVGKSPVDLGFWASESDRLENLKRVMDPDNPHLIELWFVRADGRRILIQIEGRHLSLGGVPHILIYLRDLTVQREAQQALDLSERAVQQAHSDLVAQLELFELTESLARVGHWTVPQGADRPTWSKGLYALAETPWEPGMTFDTARERIHPDDFPAFMAHRKALDGRLLEYRSLRSDGSLQWLRTRMHRQHRDNGSYVDVGVVQDFTEEREAKVALHERVEMVQRLTSRLPDMLFQYVHSVSAPGVFAFVSDACLNLFGVSPESVRADSTQLFRWVHPEDRPEMLRTMQSAAASGAQWTQEFRSRRADGSILFLLGRAITVLEPSGQYIAYGSVTDVTAQKDAQATLRDSEARFRSLTELSSDWYWQQDAEFRFVRFDGAMGFKTGEESLGRTRWDLGAINMTEADWDEHRRILHTHQAFREFELCDTDMQGQVYWRSISGAPVFDANGEFQGYRGVGRDITARKVAEEKIEKLAFYDVLTGLPNRRLLVDRLQHALVSVDREGGGALLFLDLDNFKDLNDTHGHDVGDLLLQQVGRRLQECVRGADTVARFGGDEFVVMLQGLAHAPAESARQAELVARKVIASLNLPYMLGTVEHHSTPSLGVTLLVAESKTVDEVLKQADLALYEAKAAGRNTLRFFDPAMQAQVAQRTAMESELRHGLRRQEMVVYYQPVVDVVGRMVGVEALVRWLHPQRGLVSPQEFIPVAEQTGLIIPLGAWVLEAACQQLAHWAESSATMALTIAVNVSARQFKQPDFAQQVLDILRKTGADARRLKLELTESLLLSDSQDAIAKMSTLQRFGVGFALDDFGTGYSSLSYLKLLPLQQLKIDQSFVRDVLTDPNDAAIARTVLALGKSLGFSVVAEGVENEGQRAFLRENGCTLFQGFLFGKPVPVQHLVLQAPAVEDVPPGWMI
jgi:diguanylate cyclase (GGDEF)-like protein/PAS domain S-box-containing protein